MIIKILSAVATALAWFWCGMQANIAIDYYVDEDKSGFRHALARAGVFLLCGVIDVFLIVRR